MNSVQSQRNSQSKRALDRLIAARGAWVSALDIQKVAGLQYSRAVHTIRHKWGYPIENKTERVNGMIHGYFRLPLEATPPVLTATGSAVQDTPQLTLGIAPRTEARHWERD